MVFIELHCLCSVRLAAAKYLYSVSALLRGVEQQRAQPRHRDKLELGTCTWAARHALEVEGDLVWPMYFDRYSLHMDIMLRLSCWLC